MILIPPPTIGAFYGKPARHEALQHAVTAASTGQRLDPAPHGALSTLAAGTILLGIATAALLLFIVCIGTITEARRHRRSR